MADLLWRSILKWKPDHRLASGLPLTNRTRWANDIDKLHRINCVSWDRIEAVIHWLPTSDFWAPNVQSGAKLRKQFDRLESEARKSGHATSHDSAPLTDAQLEAISVK